jgi:acetyltransferase-like isoleucine patch superfamily enzyme
MTTRPEQTTSTTSPSVARPPTAEVIHLPNVRRPSFSRLLSKLLRRFDRLLLARELRELGPRSYIARPRYLVGGRGIALGANVQIWHHAMIEIAQLYPDRPTLVIGDGTVIRPYAHIGAAVNITMGNRVGLSPMALVTDHEHDFRDPADSILTNKRILAAPVTLEDDVFLGERAVVLKGVRIGTCSLVGANSVVKDDIPPYSIAVGLPAKVVRRYDPERRAWVKD